ncbi:MAG: hypothetical protein ACN4GR_17385 [Arenicellales bacterium]
MADKKDNPPSEETAKSELTSSGSLTKPLLDEQSSEETADIDTSHLTLDESADQPTGVLESERDLEAPAIDTSHLSLEESDNTKPSNSSTKDLEQDSSGISERPPVDEPQTDTSADKHESAKDQLIVKNPLAEKASGLPAGKDDDEQVMLTTDISDAEFDKEMQTDAEGISGSDKGESSDSGTDEGSESPIKSILDTVKKPENIVRSAWSNSSARRFLIDNVESFRIKDEEQNMESVIENMYGGVVEKKFAPGKFLRENLLFSSLLFILLFLVGWKAAGIFFPEFMPAINDQIIETVQKTAGRKAADEPAEEKKPIVTNHENKEKIDAVLSSCLVTPDARMAFTSAFADVGYEFSERPLTISYEEIRASIRSWDNLNMEFYIKDASYRFRELARLALPIAQNANKIVADYKQSLLGIKQQADKLEDKIRNIKTSRGNQSTVTINERIPLLNKLDKINARLADEPDQARFDQLLKKMVLVENILSGSEKPARVEPDQLTIEDPEWLMSTADTASSDIATPIIGKVLPPIEIPADKLKKVSPKLTAFHLSELDKALDDLLKLSSLIFYIPENRLIPYKLELTGLSRRLNNKMDTELPAWMNFDRCLAIAREGIPAASE